MVRFTMTSLQLHRRVSSLIRALWPGRVNQEQHAFEFKPQLQMEVSCYLLLKLSFCAAMLTFLQQDGRKIVRARRGEPKATKLTSEAAVLLPDLVFSLLRDPDVKDCFSGWP
jgi:hypothetical protein